MALVAVALALAAPLAADTGPRFQIARATVAPAIDGLGDPVWAESELVWIGMDIYSITFRALHDGRTLYLYFEDLTNAATPGHDEFWISIDDEGGTPPQRWDGMWGLDACDADYPEESEEGAWGWIFDEGYAVDERWRQISQIGGVCADQSHLGFTRAAVAIAVPEGPATAEVAIPIEATGTTDIDPGDEIAISVEVWDDVYRMGYWPQADLARAPLAVLGCNVPEGADFNSAFPLDWEVSGSGAATWRPSGTDSGECGQTNQTGSSGDSACVTYDGSLDGAASSLISPWFSLANSTSVSLAYRGVYAEAPSNPSSQLVLELTTDGATWAPLLSWTSNHGTSGGEAVTLDLAAYAGLPRVQLRWRFAAAAGVLAGAQIDEVHLVCGPFLFSDGFETGLTTHWSAEAP